MPPPLSTASLFLLSFNGKKYCCVCVLLQLVRITSEKGLLPAVVPPAVLAGARRGREASDAEKEADANYCCGIGDTAAFGMPHIDALSRVDVANITKEMLAGALSKSQSYTNVNVTTFRDVHLKAHCIKLVANNAIAVLKQESCGGDATLKAWHSGGIDQRTHVAVGLVPRFKNLFAMLEPRDKQQQTMDQLLHSDKSGRSANDIVVDLVASAGLPFAIVENPHMRALMALTKAQGLTDHRSISKAVAARADKMEAAFFGNHEGCIVDVMFDPASVLWHRSVIFVGRVTSRGGDFVGVVDLAIVWDRDVGVEGSDDAQREQGRLTVDNLLVPMREIQKRIEETFRCHVGSWVSDNAANVVAAARKMLDAHLRCAFHTLHLAMQQVAKLPSIKAGLDAAEKFYSSNHDYYNKRIAGPTVGRLRRAVEHRFKDNVRFMTDVLAADEKLTAEVNVNARDAAEFELLDDAAARRIGRAKGMLQQYTDALGIVEGDDSDMISLLIALAQLSFTGANLDADNLFETFGKTLTPEQQRKFDAGELFDPAYNCNALALDEHVSVQSAALAPILNYALSPHLLITVLFSGATSYHTGKSLDEYRDMVEAARVWVLSPSAKRLMVALGLDSNVVTRQFDDWFDNVGHSSPWPLRINRKTIARFVEDGRKTAHKDLFAFVWGVMRRPASQAAAERAAASQRRIHTDGRYSLSHDMVDSSVKLRQYLVDGKHARQPAAAEAIDADDAAVDNDNAYAELPAVERNIGRASILNAIAGIAVACGLKYRQVADSQLHPLPLDVSERVCAACKNAIDEHETDNGDHVVVFCRRCGQVEHIGCTTLMAKMPCAINFYPQDNLCPTCRQTPADVEWWTAKFRRDDDAEPESSDEESSDNNSGSSESGSDNDDSDNEDEEEDEDEDY